MTETEQRARALEPTIRSAMQMVVDLRKRSDFEIFIKGDESPVTSADFWANEFILSEMEKLFPGERMIGEESDDKSYEPGIDILWYVDPIDGTKNYISGANPFHVLIGCCIGGEPAIGICAYPESGDIAVGGVGFPAQLWNSIGGAKNLKISPKWTDTNHHSISLKGMSENQRAIISRNGFSKAPFVHQHPTMMGAAFGISDAYIDHRTIHWWDLAGPAAIMKSLGYEVGNTFENTCNMNDGSLNTSRFHCLPKGAPTTVKKLLYHPETP